MQTVVTGRSPHRFAYFTGDPAHYDERLAGRGVSDAEAHGGLVALCLAERRLVFGEGVNLRIDADWFDDLLGQPDAGGLSLKALLATGQRVPRLGSGVLQDVLWTAGIHPGRTVATLSPEENERLFASITTVPRAMAQAGGRDTETDLFGHRGGYPTRMSRLHVGEPCPACRAPIIKEAYLGGSVYTCPGCQPR